MGEGWLAILTPLCSALFSGDDRSLNLGWLLGVQLGEVEDTDSEPTGNKTIPDQHRARRLRPARRAAAIEGRPVRASGAELLVDVKASTTVSVCRIPNSLSSRPRKLH
jgi:hypothetical protein